MSIALSTVVFIFLLLPGLIFRRFYYTEEFSKEYFKESIPSFFLSTIIPGTILHIVAWQFVRKFYMLDIPTIGILFSGTDAPLELTKAFDSLYQYIGEIIGYFFFMSVLAAFSGITCKSFIRTYKLDRRFKIFRFQNEWHYLFSGEILDFERVPGASTEIDFTFVDALVEVNNETIIYMGVLADYVLSKNGGVDRIYLTDVKRRYLKHDNDANLPDCYYTLPGKFFIISFENILNLHLTYYSVAYTPSKAADIAKAPDQISGSATSS